MAYRLLFAAVLSASALAACGGSSSETPPPLQPDPAGFRYASLAPAQEEEESDAGNAPRSQPARSESAPTGIEASPKPRVPARSTWGTGR
ncbi:MAG TPA: hypothetical protein VFJ90_06965 [Candidatus Didemnitutus sp.]|nr:hypothetical protein [Candidatus Didemnitutus sp.]